MRTKRIRFNGCYVDRKSLKLLRSLAKSLKLSQGQVIDRALTTLAVGESFGSNHLNLSGQGVFEPEPNMIDHRVAQRRAAARKQIVPVQQMPDPANLKEFKPLLKPKERK